MCNQEHSTCFGRGDKVVTFKYSTLRVWDIETPRESLHIPDPRFSKELLTQTLLECKEACNSVFNSVLTKLHNNSDPVLDADQVKERGDYRERLEKLEELIDGDDGDCAETMSLLKLFQRDIMVSHMSWTRRINLFQESVKTKPTSASSSAEPAEVTTKTRSESDTVKKLISTILPHSEDTSIPNPFSVDIHLITHVNGVELEVPSTDFVHESKPSSLISYLLSSASHQQFLAGHSPADTAAAAAVSTDSQHFVLELGDNNNTKFYCCSYFTAEFHALRQQILSDKTGLKFVKSLAECSRWEAMGGKSGLLFFKTADDRFVLKQMNKFEYQSFLEFAPHYFEYIKQSLQNNVKTLLGKIVGVYKVGFKNSVTGAGMSMEFLIMENLFYAKQVSKSYDLKGSVRNRLILEADSQQQGMVLLDENLLRVSCEEPLYVSKEDKDALNEAIKRDAAFLASHHMMDYSLLAGICGEDNSLVVGIIDYIRTFTWDKKLET